MFPYPLHIIVPFMAPINGSHAYCDHACRHALHTSISSVVLALYEIDPRELVRVKRRTFNIYYTYILYV